MREVPSCEALTEEWIRENPEITEFQVGVILGMLVIPIVIGSAALLTWLINRKNSK